jgi:uncharacterized protein
MSAVTPPVAATTGRNGHNTLDGWRSDTRVVLQPIAAPSILGLFGFAGATFIVAAFLARWYGTATTPEFLFPFAAAFGGVAQFAAALWAYRARDGLATAMHGMWGSFWIAYGVLFLLGAIGVLRIPAGRFTELGFWFLALAAITLSGAVAALAENLSLSAVLWTLTVGAGLLAVGYLTGGATWIRSGGWVLLVSAALAWYTATAMMLESSFGRVILPVGARQKRLEPAAHAAHLPIEFPMGEPGVRHGQ